MEIYFLVIIFLLLLTIIVMQLLYQKERSKRDEHLEDIITTHQDQDYLKTDMLMDIHTHYEDIYKRYIERDIVKDSHYQANQRTMFFLLLQKAGYKLPADEEIRLANDFFDEGLEKTEAINRKESEMRNHFMSGEGK